MPLSPEDVRALVAAFDGSDWDEMTLTIDGTHLVLSRTGRPPGTAAASGTPRRRRPRPLRPPRRPPQAPLREAQSRPSRRPPRPSRRLPRRLPPRPPRRPPPQEPSRPPRTAPRSAARRARRGHRPPGHRPLGRAVLALAQAGCAALRRGGRRGPPGRHRLHRRGDEADEPRPRGRGGHGAGGAPGERPDGRARGSALHRRARGLRWGCAACSSPTAARSRSGSCGRAPTPGSRASSPCPRPTANPGPRWSPTGGVHRPGRGERELPGRPPRGRRRRWPPAATPSTPVRLPRRAARLARPAPSTGWRSSARPPT